MMERVTHKLLIRTELNAAGEIVRTFAALRPPHHASAYCECDPIKDILSEEEGADRIVLYIHHHAGESP